MQPFTISRLPRLLVGKESVARLAGIITENSWKRIGLILGSHGFAVSEDMDALRKLLAEAGITALTYRYDQLPDRSDRFHEATPVVVDAIANDLRKHGADAVVAIGGGSAIDTGKAVSAAMRLPGSIHDYLEGVGTRLPDGAKVPFVAIPTTAGTGSEATKNAVLSEVGESGFKKSLRHDNYVPDVAILDPLIQLSCPRSVTAASGMDAITQLLEAYLSTNASPFTDALALDGLAWAGRSFIPAVERGDTDVTARTGMAYAAYLSGICLANAGLGVVHGLAGAAGAHLEIPHGLFCGALLPFATQHIAERLSHLRDASGTLAKLSSASTALLGLAPAPLEQNIARLVDRLFEFARVAALPGLREYGFTDELAGIVAGEGDNKNSPVEFDASERADMIRQAI